MGLLKVAFFVYISQFMTGPSSNGETYTTLFGSVNYGIGASTTKGFEPSFFSTMRAEEPLIRPY